MDKFIETDLPSDKIKDSMEEFFLIKEEFNSLCTKMNDMSPSAMVATVTTILNDYLSHNHYVDTDLVKLVIVKMTNDICDKYKENE